MKRLHAYALAALLVVAVAGMSGCSSWFESPAKPANDAISLANTHLKKAAQIEQQIAADTASLDALPYTKAGATQGLELTAKLKTALTAEKTELAAAKAALTSIQAMQVDAKYKEYAKLEAAVVETRITRTDTSARLFNAMDALFKGLSGKSGTTAIDPQEFQVVVGQIQQELTDLNTQAEQQAKAAADYFANNNLGK